MWFNFGPSVSSWTDGPVAAPIIYSETIPGGEQRPVDGRREVRHQEREQLARLQSRVGMSPTASASQLDYHDSTAESAPTARTARTRCSGVAGFFRGTTTGDFSSDFPVMSVVLPAARPASTPSADDGHRLELPEQLHEGRNPAGQLDGHFDFTETSRLDFGVAFTEVNNRSAFSNVQQDTWGGASGRHRRRLPGRSVAADTMRQYFDNIGGSSNPNLFNEFFTWDFETVRQLAADAGNPAMYEANPNFTTDRRTQEDSNSAYIQFVHYLRHEDSDRDGPGRALRGHRGDFECARADGHRHQLGGPQ